MHLQTFSQPVRLGRGAGLLQGRWLRRVEVIPHQHDGPSIPTLISGSRGTVGIPGEGYKDLGHVATCGTRACEGNDLALAAEARFRARF